MPQPESTASHSLVGLAIQRSDYAGFFCRIERLPPTLVGCRGRARRLCATERERFERHMHTPPLLDLWGIELDEGDPPRRAFSYLACDPGFPMPGIRPDPERRYLTWALARPSAGRSWELFGQLSGVRTALAQPIAAQTMMALCNGQVHAAREGRAAWDAFVGPRSQRAGGCWASVPSEVLDALDSGVPPPFGHPRPDRGAPDDPLPLTAPRARSGRAAWASASRLR